MEMFKTIAGNKLDVSKLHLLILPGYRQGFDSSPDDDETKPIERLARMLKISKDDSENKHFRLAKANKNFPSMEYFLAAFSEMATRRVYSPLASRGSPCGERAGDATHSPRHEARRVEVAHTRVRARDDVWP